MRGGNSPASAARMMSTALSESACAAAGIERDDLVMERLGVLVERGEQRRAEIHVGHVDLELGVVDRLGELDAALDEIGPGLGVERLVLEQRRPGDPDVGSGDDHAVDMSADAAVRDREAELPPSCALSRRSKPAARSQRMDSVSN